MAEYLNSDRDLLMTRKFGYLHPRVLLDLQSEIICLEEDLRGMDEHDAKNNPAALKSRSANEYRREGFTRRSLLQNINSRLAEYRDYDSLSSSFSLTGLLDGVVERIRSFESLANPPPSEVQSFCKANLGGRFTRDHIPTAVCRPRCYC